MGAAVVVAAWTVIGTTESKNCFTFAWSSAKKGYCDEHSNRLVSPRFSPFLWCNHFWDTCRAIQTGSTHLFNHMPVKCTWAYDVLLYDDVAVTSLQLVISSESIL